MVRGEKKEVPNSFEGDWSKYKMFSLTGKDGKYITGYRKSDKKQLRRYEYVSVPFTQEEIPNSIAEINKIMENRNTSYKDNPKLWMKFYMRAYRSRGWDGGGTRKKPKKSKAPDSQFQGSSKRKNYEKLIKESKKEEKKEYDDEVKKIKEQTEMNEDIDDIMESFEKSASKGEMATDEDEEPKKKGRGKGKVDKKKAFQEKAKERSEAAQKIQTQFRKKKEEDKKKKEAEEKKKRQEKIKADRKLIEDRAKAKAEKEKKEKEKIAKRKAEKERFEKENFTSEFNRIKNKKIADERDDDYDGWVSEMDAYDKKSSKFRKLIKIAKKRKYPKKTIDIIEKELGRSEYMSSVLLKENRD